MSEKVRLPKDVCDALDAVGKVHTYKTIISRHITKSWHEEYEILNEGNMGTILLMRALILGYEPELSVEEKAKELFFNCNENQFAGFDGPYTIVYRLGIIDGLRTHGIHYDWMEDAK
jgi:predicted small secreted protein